MKIRPVGAEKYHADGRTGRRKGGQTDGRKDGRTDTTKLIAAFRNFASVLKNVDHVGLINTDYNTVAKALF